MIPPLAPTFEAALRDVRARQPKFREAAAVRLADPPEERAQEAIEGLRALTGDPNGDVRALALESLGQLGESSLKGVALDAFEDEYPPARQAAVLAYGRMDPHGADTVIAPLLDDERPDVRFSAVWTLTHLGREHAGVVARALTDDDPEVRLLGAQCLADLEAQSHRDEIAALLDDREDSVRFEAAVALASLHDDRGAEALRRSLAHPSRGFRAAVGLGDLRDHESHEAFLRLARHPFRSPILRAAAARGLVTLGDARGTEILRTLVRSWRIEARQYAVQLVGELELTELAEDLAKGFRKRATSERVVYETALEQLAAKSPEARALLASLRQADHPT